MTTTVMQFQTMQMAYNKGIVQCTKYSMNIGIKLSEIVEKQQSKVGNLVFLGANTTCKVGTARAHNQNIRNRCVCGPTFFIFMPC